jgi:hypothetical protein
MLGSRRSDMASSVGVWRMVLVHYYRCIGGCSRMRLTHDYPIDEDNGQAKAARFLPPACAIDDDDGPENATHSTCRQY